MAPGVGGSAGVRQGAMARTDRPGYRAPPARAREDRTDVRRLGIWLLFLALVGGFAAGVWRAGFTAALEPLARRGQADLALAADRLTGELLRFKELAVADGASIRRRCRSCAGRRRRATAEPLLRRVADKTGSLGHPGAGAGRAGACRRRRAWAGARDQGAALERARSTGRSA